MNFVRARAISSCPTTAVQERRLTGRLHVHVVDDRDSLRARLGERAMDIVEGILERQGAILIQKQAVCAVLAEGIERENGMTWNSMLTSVVGPLRGADLRPLLLLLMSMASYWYNLLFRVRYNQTSSPSVMPCVSPLVVYDRSRG